jgi:hypothetical protein
MLHLSFSQPTLMFSLSQERYYIVKIHVFWKVAPYPLVNSEFWEERSDPILRVQKSTTLNMVVVNSQKRLQLFPVWQGQKA